MFCLYFPLSFIVFGLTFRYLIHFEFIFVYGVRKCSNFILSRVAFHFPQHHLLKRLSFPHCIFLLPLSKIRNPQVHGFVWAFYLIPLVYISVFVPVPYCLDDCSFAVCGFVVWAEVRKVGFSSSIFLSQDCFGYSGSFVFPYELWKFLFYFCEKCDWQFDRDHIESVDCIC